VADAATTPYQAAKRADLQPGDNVVIIGITGGVDNTWARWRSPGCQDSHRIARNEEKLQRALKHGADLVINSKDKDAGAVSKEFRELL